jgi:dTDP-4-amino-4,6-dideoxygalactose transaminase
MLDKPLPILPIVRPTFPPLESIADRFSAALKSGHVTNGGQYVEQFEAALTEYLGVPTICFSSGMAALVAMLMVDGVEGKEVICPSFTFCATPHAVKLAGGNVVFADVDPNTLTLDPADVSRKITKHTNAILGVDAYGICCDYAGLSKVAVDNYFVMLLDSAPAFGSMWQVRPTACPMDAPQIFSFHATKPFAVGEGGALCSTDTSFIDAAKKIRNFGIPGRVGFNGKMQEINALIGLEQLKTWRDIPLVRSSSALDIAEIIQDVPGVKCIFGPDDQIPVWTYLPILIDEEFGMSRDDVMAALAKRWIMTRKYYEACHLNPVYAAERTILPVTERVASQVIALPVYNDMTAAECERIAGAIREIQEVGK